MNDFFQMVTDEAKAANFTISDLTNLTALLQNEIKKQQEKQIKELKNNLYNAINAIQKQAFKFLFKTKITMNICVFFSQIKIFLWIFVNSGIVAILILC